MQAPILRSNFGSRYLEIPFASNKASQHNGSRHCPSPPRSITIAGPRPNARADVGLDDRRPEPTGHDAASLHQRFQNRAAELAAVGDRLEMAESRVAELEEEKATTEIRLRRVEHTLTRMAAAFGDVP